MCDEKILQHWDVVKAQHDKKLACLSDVEQESLALEDVVIGSGSYGTVNKARWGSAPNKVAVKVPKLAVSIEELVCAVRECL